MKQRVITGIILIAILLIIGIINNHFLTGLVIIIVSAISLFEAKKLFNIDDENLFYFSIVIVVLSLFINPIVVGVFGAIIGASYIAFYQKELKNISILIYPTLSFLFIYELYLKYGIGTLGWLILIVALTDILAYFVGKNFAKRFINVGFCKTSPNKSWEGVIGGVVGSVMISSIVGLYFFDFLNALIISFVVSVSSIFGDLFESYLKRKAGVKDSGDILPGHGGVLDRVDGYLFAAPIMLAILGI